MQSLTKTDYIPDVDMHDSALPLFLPCASVRMNYSVVNSSYKGALKLLYMSTIITIYIPPNFSVPCVRFPGFPKIFRRLPKIAEDVPTTFKICQICSDDFRRFQKMSKLISKYCK